ncbi:hypothetical protein [Prevotella jejuni]|uniref:hypothetical protein n=1 Tax=Prevotella jejuni TaxID=1177574 RepID=UPI0028E19702|nr:hypothetical protein [Prevotella jejuni]
MISNTIVEHEKLTIQHETIDYTRHLYFCHNRLTLYDKSSTKGDNLRFLRPFDTISDRSVRYDYNATGYLSGPMYVDFCQWRNLNVMKLKSMMNS